MDEDRRNRAMDALQTLSLWMKDLDPPGAADLYDYEMDALFGLADGIHHLGAMRMAELSRREIRASLSLVEFRCHLRKVLGLGGQEEVPLPPSLAEGGLRTSLTERIEAMASDPRNAEYLASRESASGERSDTTAPTGDGGPAPGGATRTCCDGSSLTEARSRASRENSRVGSGPFQGLHLFASAACRDCQTCVKVYQAVKGLWPERDLCPECGFLRRRVRSGPVKSAPWEGVPDDAPVMCDGCGARNVAAIVRDAWPLPDICRECERATLPKNISAKDALALKECIEEIGASYTTQPIVTISPEGAKQVGEMIFVSAPKESGALGGEKGGNPRSRKRPRAVGNANNWREKREDHHASSTGKAH